MKHKESFLIPLFFYFFSFFLVESNCSLIFAALVLSSLLFCNGNIFPNVSFRIINQSFGIVNQSFGNLLKIDLNAYIL